MTPPEGTSTEVKTHSWFRVMCSYWTVAAVILMLLVLESALLRREPRWWDLVYLMLLFGFTAWSRRAVVARLWREGDTLNVTTVSGPWSRTPYRVDATAGVRQLFRFTTTRAVLIPNPSLVMHIEPSELDQLDDAISISTAHPEQSGTPLD